jgi:hypothetical protein
VRHRRLIAVTAVVLAVAACERVGGGDSGPLSKDSFVDKANEICADSRTAAAQIPPPSLADPVAVEQAVARTITIQRAALRDLRDLEPPPRDKPGVKQWLRTVDRVIDAMERVDEGLKTGDRAVIDDATIDGQDFSDSAEEFADAYGLTDCSTSQPEQR